MLVYLSKLSCLTQSLGRADRFSDTATNTLKPCIEKCGQTAAHWHMATITAYKNSSSPCQMAYGTIIDAYNFNLQTQYRTKVRNEPPSSSKVDNLHLM